MEITTRGGGTGAALAAATHPISTRERKALLKAMEGTISHNGPGQEIVPNPTVEHWPGRSWPTFGTIRQFPLTMGWTVSGAA